MPSIRLQNMGGIAPRISPRLLPLSAARIARGTNLWSGEVRAFRPGGPQPDEMPQPVVQTLFHIAGAWLAWQEDVDVVLGFTASEDLGRVYYTGDGAPKVIQQAIAAGEAPTPTSAYPLGIPPPVFPPLVETTAPSGSPYEFRTYLYTWVTLFGEESVPSPPSLVLLVQDGVEVLVDYSTSMPPANVTQVNIYRSNGGPFIYVGTAAVGAGVFSDRLTNDEIEGNEQLQSQHWYPPPPNLQGLIGTANGFLAGFYSNKVAFSEPYQPHAWPPEYVKIFDYPVVALATYGTTVVVFTTGYTYLVEGVDPRQLTVARVPDSYPCVSKRSVSTGDNGVYYASAVGLGFVGSGGVDIVTKNMMDEDDWAAWLPHTMHGTVYDGFYFGFYLSGEEQLKSKRPQGAGFMFDISDRATGALARALLITLPYYATAVFAAPDVRMHYVVAFDTASQLLEWNRGANYEEYLWRSKEVVFPFLVSFAAAKVVCRCNDNRRVFFRLLDGACEQVLYERLVTSAQPFRLPPLNSRLDWSVEVAGTADVQEIHVATSMAELREDE